MTDHTGENITINISAPIGDGHALSEAIARAIEAGKRAGRIVVDAAVPPPAKLPWWRRWFRWR